MQTHSVPMSALSPLIGEILSFGGDVVLTVTGHSMEPMLHDRVSRVRLTAPRTLKPATCRFTAAQTGLTCSTASPQWTRTA